MRTSECFYLDLGLIEYSKALKIQEKCVILRKKNLIPDTIILLEHYPVITLGKGGNEESIIAGELLKRKGVTFFKINRGGDVTYHGPGQLVCYPILNLIQYKKDLHWYVRSLEKILINLLADLTIKAESKKGYPGVWVEQDKVAAIGIAISQWVTMHGIALNVEIDLEYFKYIHPCGIKDKGVTSITKILGKTVDEVALKQRFIDYFAVEFNKKNMIKVDNRDLEACFNEYA